MLGNKKVLAIVPARGGSKGLPGKNLKHFRGFSLVANVGNLIKDFLIIDRAIVSTDSLEIAEEAKCSGLDVPFYRPKDLSGDLVSDIQVLKHALIEIEAIDKVVYDIVLNTLLLRQQYVSLQSVMINQPPFLQLHCFIQSILET